MQTYTVLMPDIGEGVVEGEVTAWLKNVGDALIQDEPVVELMTDKATVELPTPYPGTLAKQYYKVGDIAIKGKPLYDVSVSSEIALPQVKHEDASTPAPQKKVPTATHSPVQARIGEKALATPQVRKMACEMGIDINQIQGTGKDGRVVAEDLKGMPSATQSSTAATRLEGDVIQPLVGIRRLVAKKMAESKRTIPHFGFCDKADVSLLTKFRDKNKQEATKQGIHLTFVPLFIRALSLTLKAFPQVNASVDDAAQAIILHRSHNVGIAMKTPQGLIVPVLKDVETLSFHETIRNYQALRQRAVKGELKPDDMRDSTITLSNFGTEGGLWATPVINFPEAAILATAKIHKEPVVRGNSIVIRDILNCSWSFDHRIIDGDLAAAFSNHFIKLIENPSSLL
ncbi:MAG: dihydrolipoamide acetyltransferase family protein [Chlamydiales bacterium]|nr:dihydrolipoamide acetyltransferase family protein [Chlamydiales bacterium]